MKTDSKHSTAVLAALGLTAVTLLALLVNAAEAVWGWM
jgi:hypothetical protein